MEATRQLDELPRVLAGLGGPTGILQRGNVVAVSNDPMHRTLLGLLTNSTQTVQACLDVVPIPDLDAARLLVELASTGAVRATSAPPRRTGLHPVRGL
jgi:hypothetical protein